MRKTLIFLLFILPAALLADTVGNAPPNQAIFKSVQGDVLVRTKKDTHPAKQDMVVNQGDTIIARQGGSAVLRLFDGSEVSVDPQTEFIISKLKKGQGNDKFIRFKMLIGKITSVVEKLTTAKSRFEVEGGGVVCAVRGTIVINILDPIGQAMGVAVQKGAVAVTSAPSASQPNPLTQLIPAGNTTTQLTNPLTSPINALMPIGAKTTSQSTAAAQILVTQKTAFLSDFAKVGITDPNILKQVAAILSQPVVSLQGLQALDQLVLVAAAKDQQLAVKDPAQAKQMMVVLNSMTQNLQNIATLEKGSIPATNASASNAQILAQAMSNSMNSLVHTPAQTAPAPTNGLNVIQLAALKLGQNQMTSLVNQTNPWLQSNTSTAIMVTYAQLMQTMVQNQSLGNQMNALNMLTMTNMAISSSQQILSSAQAAASAQQQQAAISLAGTVSTGVSAVTSLAHANSLPHITINPAPTNPSPSSNNTSSSTSQTQLLNSLTSLLPNAPNDSIDVLLAQAAANLKNLENKADKTQASLSETAVQKQLQDKTQQLKAALDVLNTADPKQAKTFAAISQMLQNITSGAANYTAAGYKSQAAYDQAEAAQLQAIQSTMSTFMDSALSNLKNANDTINSVMDMLNSMIQSQNKTASQIIGAQGDSGPAPQAVQHQDPNDTGSLNDPALQVLNGNAPGSNSATQTGKPGTNSGTNNSLNTIQQYNNTNNSSSPHGSGSGGD